MRNLPLAAPTGMRRVHRGRSGQAGLIMVMGLLVTMSALGFVVDLGWAYYKKQVCQAAADAAATAAAVTANANGAVCGTGGVLCQATAATCTSLSAASNLKVGCQYATSNGFTDGATLEGGTQTVTMQSGTGNPPNGPSNSQNYWVVATVSQTVPQTFLRWAGFTTATVNAQSTAGVGQKAYPGPKYCMYALDPTAAKSFLMTGGTSSVNLTSCGIYVNSTANSSTTANSNALVTNGGASVIATGGGTIDVRGGGNTNGTYCPSGTLTCSATAVADPLLTLEAPTFSGCDLGGSGTGYTAAAGTTLNPTSKAVFVICDGLTVNSSTVNINPGVYVLNGGGLTVSGGGTLAGSGVMFYNTATTGHTIKEVVFSGGSSVTLSAPATGTYRGVLFYQDRTTSYANSNQLNGGATPSLTGVIYFPGSKLLFTGASSTSSAYAVLIAKTITLSGGSYLTWDSTGTKTGLAPVAAPYLMQ